MDPEVAVQTLTHAMAPYVQNNVRTEDVCLCDNAELGNLGCRYTMAAFISGLAIYLSEIKKIGTNCRRICYKAALFDQKVVK